MRLGPAQRGLVKIVASVRISDSDTNERKSRKHDSQRAKEQMTRSSGHSVVHKVVSCDPKRHPQYEDMPCIRKK